MELEPAGRPVSRGRLMARVTHVHALDEVARRIGENRELIEIVSANSDNIDDGEMIWVDNIQFANRSCDTTAFEHIFGRVCREHGIEHRLTKVRHPWTNGQVERMNRTIKEATVKRFHYDNHDQLRTHLDDFIAAYNFARRLKTLNGLTPYEYICKVWTSEADRFIVNPIHQMPGLNNYGPWTFMVSTPADF
jgi:hypothetical protein